MNESRYRIAVVSGTRADYGLLKPVIRRVQEAPDLELQLILSAMHLSPAFGHTATEVLADGFEITETIEMLLSTDTTVGMSKSTGLGIIGFADALNRLKPDLVVGLGDRFELMSAVIAAMMQRIPVAHIHGGETSEGAVDEFIRHAITKMSHLHFVSTDEYRQRVLQLGENPASTFNVGALAVENTRDSALMDSAEFAAAEGFAIERPFFILTFHPATLEAEQAGKQARQIVRALDDWADATCIVTSPNADAESGSIAGVMRDYCAKKPSHRRFVKSLGQRRYMSAVALADVVIGNSSSGLIEAPLLGTPTVNIGDRQRGRVSPPSVIHCNANEGEIRAAIKTALGEKIQAIAEKKSHPYGDGTASLRIVEEISHALRVGIDLKKTFHSQITAIQDHKWPIRL